MSLFWIIYLVDVLDISEGLALYGVFSLLIFVGGKVILALSDQESSYNQDIIRLGKLMSLRIIFVAAVFSIILATLLPSKETSYKMLAAYGVTEAYTAAQQSDKVQAIAGKSLKVLEKAMDSYLDEGVK